MFLIQNVIFLLISLWFLTLISMRFYHSFLLCYQRYNFLQIKQQFLILYFFFTFIALNYYYHHTHSTLMDLLDLKLS